MYETNERRRRPVPLIVNNAGNWPEEWEDKLFHILLEFSLQAHFEKGIPDWMHAKVAQQTKERIGLPFTDCIVSKKFAHCHDRFYQLKFIREIVGWFKWNGEKNAISILTTPDAWESFVHVSYQFLFILICDHVLCTIIKVCQWGKSFHNYVNGLRKQKKR